MAGIARKLRYYMRYYCTLSSPIGMIYLECNHLGITGLWLENQRHFPADLSLRSVLKPDHPMLLQAEDWLIRYFAGYNPDPNELTLIPDGTEFRLKVWQQLRTIPYAATITYGDLARAIGKPNAFQAIGNAVGNNPISIIIPCHRVVGSNGNLTGYAGGLSAKQYLLSLEQKER